MYCQRFLHIQCIEIPMAQVREGKLDLLLVVSSSKKQKYLFCDIGI